MISCTEQKSLKQPLELFVANVSLSPQLGACSRETSVTKLAVSSSHDIRPPVGRKQPTSSLVRDELTVRSQVWWHRARPRVVDQDGDLKVHPLLNQKPVQLVQHRRDMVIPLGTRHQACSSILNRLQRGHQSVRYSVEQWVAVFQVTAPGPTSSRHEMTWIWWMVGAAVAGSSRCDIQQPPVQTMTADCQWWCPGHTLYPRHFDLTQDDAVGISEMSALWLLCRATMSSKPLLLSQWTIRLTERLHSARLTDFWSCFMCCSLAEWMLMRVCYIVVGCLCCRCRPLLCLPSYGKHHCIRRARKWQNDQTVA